MRTRLFSLIAVLSLVLALAVGALWASPSHDAFARTDDGKNDVTLLASGARTATGTGSWACGYGKFTKLGVQLVVTAASGTTPTLDVVIQHSIDGGTTAFTLITFTQATAATSALKIYSDFDNSTALMIGDCLRVSYTVGGTTPSFTFSVSAEAQ